MELALAIVGLVLGSGGIASVITAKVQARRVKKTLPAELRGLEAKVQVDLVGAAGSIIDQLQEEIEGFRQERAQWAARLSEVEKNLTEWRKLAELREHELEQSRMHMARQDETLASQEGRIAALEAEVRRLGGDPDNVPRQIDPTD